MEEFNLHRINPEIQQFCNCFNFHSQAGLDELLTSLIKTCGYQRYLKVNQNISIEISNLSDLLDKSTGAIETNTVAYFSPTENYM